MFKRDVVSISSVLQTVVRKSGLETPLLQYRLLAAWDEVAGSVVAKYTAEKYIKNQTLFVKVQNAALRQNLSMMRRDLIQRLNHRVGSFVITEIKFF